MEGADEFEPWIEGLLAPEAHGRALEVLLHGLVERAICLGARARWVEHDGRNALLAEAFLGAPPRTGAEHEPRAALPPDRRRVEVAVERGRVVLELWDVAYGAGDESEQLEALLLLALTLDATHAPSEGRMRPRPSPALDLRKWLEGEAAGMEPELREALLLALFLDPDEDP